MLIWSLVLIPNDISLLIFPCKHPLCWFDPWCWFLMIYHKLIFPCKLPLCWFELYALCWVDPLRWPWYLVLTQCPWYLINNYFHISSHCVDMIPCVDPVCQHGVLSNLSKLPIISNYFSISVQSCLTSLPAIESTLIVLTVRQEDQLEENQIKSHFQQSQKSLLFLNF